MSGNALTMQLLELLFYTYECFRSLPSFPTRRSSDLENRRRTDRAGRRSARRQQRTTRSVRRARRRRSSLRSEEHTSELQSRRDLVCRLLLEKKKKSIGLRY